MCCLQRAHLFLQTYKRTEAPFHVSYTCFTLVIFKLFFNIYGKHNRNKILFADEEKKIDDDVLTI